MIDEIRLRYLEIENPFQFPLPTRQDKIAALTRIQIAVAPGQSPLDAWALAERSSFSGDGGTDSIDYAWFCWDRGGYVTLEPGVHVL